MSTAARGPLLGIDYGRARIGIALSDRLGISTTPFGFIQRTTDNEAAQMVAGLARQENVLGIVLGLPLHAAGDEGTSVSRVRRFIKRLRIHSDLPVYEVDERWSSEEAEEILRSEGNWPAKPGDIDARSAAIILRRHLDDADISGDQGDASGDTCDTGEQREQA